MGFREILAGAQLTWGHRPEMQLPASQFNPDAEGSGQQDKSAPRPSVLQGRSSAHGGWRAGRRGRGHALLQQP
eukprot:7248508-Alexandrium_andersonii.AAC.1